LSSYISSNKTCIVCDSGEIPNEDKTGCTGCEPGTYNNESTKGRCLDCGLGTYSDVEGGTVCKSCSEGSYQNVMGKKD
jgi:CO dehydrogenase/acetyl-CoA synthase beta subunit